MCSWQIFEKNWNECFEVEVFAVLSKNVSDFELKVFDSAVESAFNLSIGTPEEKIGKYSSIHNFFWEFEQNKFPSVFKTAFCESIGKNLQNIWNPFIDSVFLNFSEKILWTLSKHFWQFCQATFLRAQRHFGQKKSLETWSRSRGLGKLQNVGWYLDVWNAASSFGERSFDSHKKKEKPVHNLASLVFNALDVKKSSFTYCCSLLLYD